MRTLALSGAVLLGATAMLPACVYYTPKGGALPSPDTPATYYSYEMRPVTIRLIDVRTDEEVFVMDVPPGRQLVVGFVSGEGHDPVYAPDLMEWELMEIGTTSGRLTNKLAVPTASSRRIDVEYREGPEFREAPEVEVRSDEMLRQADWWTGEGGPMPEGGSTGGGYYDDY